MHRDYFQLFKYQSLHLWMIQTIHNYYHMVKILVISTFITGTQEGEEEDISNTSKKTGA